MAKRGRRLWCKAESASGTLRIYVTAYYPKDDDGSECDALYDPESSVIEVRWRPDENRMKQDLHHELMHRCFGGHSGQAREKVLRSSTVAGRFKREEDIVSFLEPIQFDLLTRNGWLKYPKPPKVTL